MLTKEQKKEYLESDGVKCPYCKSDNISGLAGFDTDFDQVWQNCCCNECDMEWTDFYTLTGVEEVDT